MFKLFLDEVVLPCTVLIAAFLFLLVDDKGGTAFYGGMLCSMITPIVMTVLFFVRRSTKNDGREG